jgi:hypothetical protein
MATDIVSPKPYPQWSALAQSVVRVGEGRGFVVNIGNDYRIIVTAAHCLPGRLKGNPALYLAD